MMFPGYIPLDTEAPAPVLIMLIVYVGVITRSQIRYRFFGSMINTPVATPVCLNDLNSTACILFSKSIDCFKTFLYNPTTA